MGMLSFLMRPKPAPLALVWFVSDPGVLRSGPFTIVLDSHRTCRLSLRYVGDEIDYSFGDVAFLKERAAHHVQLLGQLGVFS